MRRRQFRLQRPDSAMDGRSHAGCPFHSRQDPKLPSELRKRSRQAMFRRPQRHDLWDALDKDRVRWEDWPRAGVERSQRLSGQPGRQFLGAHQCEHNCCSTSPGKRHTVNWHDSVLKHQQHIWDPDCNQLDKAFLRLPATVGTQLDPALGDPSGFVVPFTLLNRKISLEYQPYTPYL